MTPEEIRELWARFLTGAEITLEEQKALVDAMDADPQLRDSLLENFQLDRVLHSMSATRIQGESFARILSDCVNAEHDGTRFVKKVELRLGEPEPPPTRTSGTARRSKPPTTRIFRHRSASSAPGETAWKPALIAAAVLLGLVFLITDSKSPAPKGLYKPSESVGKAPPSAPEAPKAPELPAPPARPEVQPEPFRPRLSPPAVAEKPEDRPKPALTEEERRRTEEELKKAVVKVPKAETKAEPLPAAIPPATLERVEGAVYIARSPSDKPLAKKGDVLPAGYDLETKLGGSATLVFPDGTRVELGPQSSFREMAAAPDAPNRRLFLAYGTLDSDIAKQPAGRPLVFVTPNAEAAILGTTIRLAVSPDAKVGTSLEVKEGLVQFTRTLDKKSVEVAAGHFATAATGAELAMAKSFPDDILIKFGPYTPALKPGQYLDLGEEFDAKRGYGWKGPKVGPLLGMEFRNPNSGVVEVKRQGRMDVRRSLDPTVDPLKASDVVAGWASHSETWIMPVPNGRYQVTVCCGDASFEQGPHYVAIEGRPIINQLNQAGKFVERQEFVEVKDGELTMIVGGNPSGRKSIDGSDDTLINYLIIKKLVSKKK